MFHLAKELIIYHLAIWMKCEVVNLQWVARDSYLFFSLSICSEHRWSLYLHRFSRSGEFIASLAFNINQRSLFEVDKLFPREHFNEGRANVHFSIFYDYLFKSQRPFDGNLEFLLNLSVFLWANHDLKRTVSRFSHFFCFHQCNILHAWDVEMRCQNCSPHP